MCGGRSALSVGVKGVFCGIVLRDRVATVEWNGVGWARLESGGWDRHNLLHTKESLIRTMLVE